jgi:hypothetical protein
MKVPIEKILKKGVKLKAKKLDENDPKVKTLLDETLEEQKRILDLLKVPYEILNNRITI